MQWFFKNGELAKDGWNVVVDRQIEGWQHTGLRVADLAEGGHLQLPAGDLERIIFLIHGTGLQVSYRAAGESEFTKQALGGRKSPFDGPTDLIYVPMGTEVLLEGQGRVAVGEAHGMCGGRLSISRTELPSTLAAPEFDTLSV